MPATPTDIIRALSTIVEPAREKDIITLNMVRDLKVTDDRVSMTLMVKDPTAPFSDEIEGLVTKAINDRYEDVAVDINVDHEMIGLGMSAQGGAKQSIDTGATNLIAVASGKGGVGKSTVAANLAVALAKEGYDVGLVDADIYGPSVPTMFGVEDAKPRVNEQRKIVPVEKYGVKLLSMGFLVELDKAVIWRGPMVSNAVRQFLGDAEWGELDYLVLDLPPGTGDIQLTLVQSVALTGAVVVSTPQKVALADARKGVAMFDNVQVPVLGIVENMSAFIPPDMPDRKYFLFGEWGARRLADELGVRLLGEIPIEQLVREAGDVGTPAVESHPDSASAAAFTEIAREVVMQVALRNAGLPVTQSVEILYK